MIGTVRCPKCNYTQLSSSTCKSCGKEIEMAEGSDMLSPSDVMSTSMAFSQPSSPPPGVPAEGDFNREISEAGPTDETVLTGLPVDEPSVFTGTEDAGSRQLFFFGSGGTLFGIHITNLFLTILTLGVYYFWGKAKARRYTFSQTEFEGDRFAYHGTGKELFRGFIKAAVVFGGISAMTQLGPMFSGEIGVKIGVFLAGYILFLAVIPIAIVGAHRYRMSRTSWRGIRFSFRGSAGEYMKIFLRDSLFIFLTLGIYYPFWLNNKNSYLANHTYFGNKKFEYSGRGKELLGPFLLTVFLGFFTAGLLWIWYKAKEQRFLWNNMRFGEARLIPSFSFGNLAKLKLVNALMLIFSLGIAWPWVMVRKIRYNFENISLDGPLGLSEITQEAGSAEATGEGLGDMMNIEMDLGAG